MSPAIVVLLISIPLSMGIAIASGVPPERGLITAIVGGLVIGTLSGSPLQVSGPSAGLAVMVLDVVNRWGLEGLAIVVPIMGLIQATAGLLKLGQLFRAVSPAVINGMLAGIGVLIFAAQFHVAVDDSPKGSGLENLTSIPKAVYDGIFPLDGSPHEQAAIIGVLTLFVLIGWGLLKNTKIGKVPSALVAVVVASGAAAIFSMTVLKVNLPPSFLDTLAPPTRDSLSLLKDPNLILAAVALAFVASAETLLCATAVDGMHSGVRTNYDRELFAQGVGNTCCGLLGAPPTTGVITRSTANVQSGATARSSAMMVGGSLLLIMIAFPSAFDVIPRASLAALLVYIGYKLVRYRPYAEMRAHGRSELFIFVTTVVVIVAVNLLAGIITGLVLAMVKLLMSGGKQFHKLKIEQVDEGEVTHLHLRGAASFIRLPRLASALEGIEAGREVHLHVEELEYIDHACLDLLDRWEFSRMKSRAPVRVEWQTLKHRYHAKNRLDPSPDEHAEPPPEDSRLLDFVGADHIVIDPELNDVSHAIEVLGAKLAADIGVSEANLVTSVKEREKEAPTYLGRGLMVPHGKIADGNPMAGFIALSREGWDLKIPNGDKVHCIVLLVTPQSEAARHLATLAAFARLFSQHPELRDRLLDAKTPAEAHEVLSEGEAAINFSFQSRSRTNIPVVSDTEDGPEPAQA